MAMYVPDHLAWQQRIAHEDAAQRKYSFTQKLDRKMMWTLYENSPVKSPVGNHSAFTIQYAPGTSDPNSMRNKDFIHNARPNYYLIRSNEKGIRETLDQLRKTPTDKPLKLLKPKYSCIERDESKSMIEDYQKEPLRKSRYADFQVPETGYIGKSRSKPPSYFVVLKNSRPATGTLMRPDLRVRKSGVLKPRFNESYVAGLPKAKSKEKSVFLPDSKEEAKNEPTLKQHLLKAEIVKDLESLSEAELEGVKNFVKTVSEKDDTSLCENNIRKLEGAPEKKQEADAKSRASAMSKASRASAKSEVLSKYVVSLESQLQEEKQARQRIESQLTELQSMMKQFLKSKPSTK